MSAHVELQRGKNAGIVWLPTGEHFPSVTRIIKEGRGTSAPLVAWQLQQATRKMEQAVAAFKAGQITEDQLREQTKAATLEKAPKEARQKGMDQGDAQHSMLESFKLGDADALKVWKERLPDQYNALDSWLAQTKAEILECEQYAFSRTVGYGARFDVLLKIGGKTSVCNLKKGKRVYEDHRLQVAAEHGCEFMGAEDGSEALYLPDDAGVLLLEGESIEFQTWDPKDDFEAFRHVKALFDWSRGIRS